MGWGGGVEGPGGGVQSSVDGWAGLRGGFKWRLAGGEGPGGCCQIRI